MTSNTALGQIWSWVHVDSNEDMILLTRFDDLGLFLWRYVVFVL